MGIINQLDLHVANLIAAGEVVERPASCVKELVENSLDALASEITVEIKRGGVQFIRVTDNGCGMSRDDLPISLKRHATSKIKDEKDLDGIVTLGFRGEALAAISSVSDIRIMTKRKEDEAGSLLIAECGNVVDLTDAGCRNGTTVIVENLFSNVPARRKFLKKDSSEAMAVTSLVEKLALSRPDVSIRLIIDNVQKFATPGNSDLFSTIHAVLGKEFSSKLFSIKSMTLGIEVIGYAGKPDSMRANRNYQIFFINGRYFKSKTATAALEQAFDSYTEAGKFPSCVLNINIHPSLVDVNVHPTKLEVKFSNERAIFDAVYCAVKNSIINSSSDMLFETENMVPSERSYYNAFLPIEEKKEGEPEKKLTPEKAPEVVESPFDDQSYRVSVPDISMPNVDSYDPVSLRREEKPIFRSDEEKTSNEDIQFAIPDVYATENKNVEQGQKNENQIPSFSQMYENQDERYSFGKTYMMQERAEKVIPEYRIIGIAFNAYIFVEVNDKTLVIDKHAAHERIIFESMRMMMDKQNKSKQMLLLPLTERLSPDEFEAAGEYKNEICECGFDYELNREDMTVSLAQIPSFMSANAALEMLVTVAGQLAKGTGNIESAKKSFFERSLYQASCKSAMKAGIKDDDIHIKWLVENLLALPDIKYCPHGRPVAFEMSKKEIEKFFKRT